MGEEVKIFTDEVDPPWGGDQKGKSFKASGPNLTQITMRKLLENGFC